MSVPEAAMHKYYLSLATEDDVRMSRNALHMQAKTIAKLMEHAPDDQLWPCVSAAYCRHPGASFGGAQKVHHSLASGCGAGSP